MPLLKTQYHLDKRYMIRYYVLYKKLKKRYIMQIYKKHNNIVIQSTPNSRTYDQIVTKSFTTFFNCLLKNESKIYNLTFFSHFLVFLVFLVFLGQQKLRYRQSEIGCKRIYETTRILKYSEVKKNIF